MSYNDDKFQDKYNDLLGGDNSDDDLIDAILREYASETSTEPIRQDYPEERPARRTHPAEETQERPVRRTRPVEEVAERPVRRTRPAEEVAGHPVRRTRPAEEVAERPVRRTRPAEEVAERPVRRDRPAPEAQASAPRKKKLKGWQIALIVLAGVLFLVGGVGAYVFLHMYGKMNTVGKNAQTAVTPTPVAVVETEPVETPEPTPTEEPLSEEELVELERQKLEAELTAVLESEAEDLAYSKDVYNILLAGSDARDENEVARTDTMILVSINKTTKKIWLTSFQRDSYVAIPNGWANNKLNACNVLGGIPLLQETIEKNFGVTINNYATVRWTQFYDVASLLCPITVSMVPEEVDVVNYHLPETNSTLRLPRWDNQLTVNEEGIYDLDASQLLSYCRARKISNVDASLTGDTGRSYRQRNALTLIWEKVKGMSFAEQYALVEQIMSIVTTDMTPGQCASLLLNAPAILQYDIETQQIPRANTYFSTMIDGMSCYRLSFNANQAILRATIYGEESGPIYSDMTGQTVLVWSPSEE